MRRKCLHCRLREHELLRRVQQCVFAVRFMVPSGRRRRLSVRRRTIHSAVHILTLSATDRCMAAMPTIGKNSCYGGVILSLGTHFTASRATRNQLPVTTLPFAATVMCGFRERTSPRRVCRPSPLVPPVRPRRSQTVDRPIRFRRRRRRRTTTSIRYFYRPAADARAIRRCRRRSSRCRCRVASCASRSDRRRDRRRRRRARAASTARNCSSCPRIAAACVRTRRTTAWHVSNTRRVCARRERCCITAPPTTTAVTDRSAVPANRRRPAPGRRRSVVGVASGCCWRCCP